jgi:DsbC/DsbD-like thiol-disulfide interchange protein
MKRHFISALCALALGGLAGPATAQSGDVISAEVLPGWRTDRGTHMAAVRLTLAPGWKTYWRAPGEGGIPPQINFSGSRNVTAALTHFPAPEVFYANGLRSIGYSNLVVLPIEFSVPDQTSAAQLSARIDIGVCDDICMPMRLNINAILPVGGARDAAILDALAARPAIFNSPVSCELTPIDDGLRVSASYALPPGVGAGAVSVVEPGDPTVWATDTQTQISGGRITSTVEFVPPRGQPMMLDRSAIRVTVLGGAKAFELRGCD